MDTILLTGAMFLILVIILLLVSLSYKKTVDCCTVADGDGFKSRKNTRENYAGTANLSISKWVFTLGQALDGYLGPGIKHYDNDGGQWLPTIYSSDMMIPNKGKTFKTWVNQINTDIKSWDTNYGYDTTKHKHLYVYGNLYIFDLQNNLLKTYTGPNPFKTADLQGVQSTIRLACTGTAQCDQGLYCGKDNKCSNPTNGGWARALKVIGQMASELGCATEPAIPTQNYIDTIDNATECVQALGFNTPGAKMPCIDYNAKPRVRQTMFGNSKVAALMAFIMNKSKICVVDSIPSLALPLQDPSNPNSQRIEAGYFPSGGTATSVGFALLINEPIRMPLADRPAFIDDVVSIVSTYSTALTALTCYTYGTTGNAPTWTKTYAANQTVPRGIYTKYNGTITFSKEGYTDANMATYVGYIQNRSLTGEITDSQGGFMDNEVQPLLLGQRNIAYDFSAPYTSANRDPIFSRVSPQFNFGRS